MEEIFEIRGCRPTDQYMLYR